MHAVSKSIQYNPSGICIGYFFAFFYLYFCYRVLFDIKYSIIWLYYGILCAREWGGFLIKDSIFVKKRENIFKEKMGERLILRCFCDKESDRGF